MMYLLDVNALLALAVAEHEFHHRSERWVKKAIGDNSTLATCAITEIGFLRVLPQTPAAAFTVAHARKELQLLKSSLAPRIQFLADDHDAERLPTWVHWPKQVTDGHLLALANAHGGVLATLDERIPGAFLIPD